MFVGLVFQRQKDSKTLTCQSILRIIVSITNLYEIQEKYEKIKEVHVKMSKELEEAQQFIIQNIKNKENNLKLVQKEFQMVY